MRRTVRADIMLGGKTYTEKSAARADQRAGDLRLLPRADGNGTFAAVSREWRAIVARLGLPERRIGQIQRRAMRNRTSFQVELFASGFLHEEGICRELARELDLPLVKAIPRGRLVMSRHQRATALAAQGGPRLVLLREPGAQLAVLVSPVSMDIAELKRLGEARPALAARLRVVVPSALRRAVIEASGAELQETARNRLHLEHPRFSARTVATGWQGALLGTVAVALPVMFWLDWSSTWLAVHAVFSVFFLACVALRATAALGAARPGIARLGKEDPGEMPVYTVLVALYREAAMVPQLMVALSRINWPRSKLEIKLVCEADDGPTLAALNSLRLHPCVEIVEVPPGEPRTKPKALAYALPMSSGQLVTLYDAEDQPHPDQLLEAWQRFRQSDETLACLQAPLVVVNASSGVFPTMFAFEYAALFRGLLPWLARNRLILPLGGTSNHFRRSALEEVGGWDPCNVTEDADLGVRLARFGYRCETITRPTLEDAPRDPLNWGRQRTRWFKGWMQTWLVHLRSPGRLLAEIGPRAFALSQVLLIGMIVSALANLIFLSTLLWIGLLYLTGTTIGAYHQALFAIDFGNILLGYLAFLALGWRTLLPGERKSFWKVALLTPAYWLAMSLAAWRAVWQLYRRPHHWEKTDHPPRRAPRP